MNLCVNEMKILISHGLIQKGSDSSPLKIAKLYINSILIVVKSVDQTNNLFPTIMKLKDDKSRKYEALKLTLRWNFDTRKIRSSTRYIEPEATYLIHGCIF